jgi:prophage antirepressor-like protein
MKEHNMSNVITLPTAYSFDSNQIRVSLIDGEPWFVAADICRAIGIGNPSKALMALDADEKQTVSTDDDRKGQRGGARFHSLVSESGMYTLVLRCREAVTPGTNPHRFRKWVTSEVLPSIRKTGAYAVDVAPEVPLLINHQQQMALERAVHDLALYAGSKGRNYRSVCLTTWRDLRQQFDLKEYCQLPAERFQEAIDFVLDKRAEWEVDCDARGYTLENFMDMMHDFYIEGRVPARVEVELARQCLMRARDAIVETKLQIGGLHVSDPEARKCINNARRILSRRNLNVPIDPAYAGLRRVA